MQWSVHLVQDLSIDEKDIVKFEKTGSKRDATETNDDEPWETEKIEKWKACFSENNGVYSRFRLKYSCF